MKQALISDIHANRAALDAVLADISSQECDEIFCLGDIVGYGADPDYVANRLQDEGIKTLAGNHDYDAVRGGKTTCMNPDAAKALFWTQKIHRIERRSI